MMITIMVTRNMTISDLPSVSIEYRHMTIAKYRHCHHDGNWISDHISNQTPSQQKIALIDRFVQNSIDICTGGHLGYLFAKFTLQKMVNFRKADKKTNMRVKNSKF